MIKIGMLIGDRYEILEKIGTGGMSDVYKAKCHKLNRHVAVKVLKQEFSENANFVSKFKVEAQAAAGLMHPNIVNVYDVGEENGIYYIVMELVEGITLKKYIEKKARLSAKEAVSIAIQVSMGIEAAHNNGIIHRDIKPQNIIISKDGKVKVTDFGIAKAATSNTITSNVMGSVHYTSPEQARGGFSDAKSDIYSLGITLFEMLTGRVPFNGETTVAIAIKHIQEPLPSPRSFVEEIPISVEQIVMKCTQKSPDRRYQSMGELTQDLKQSLMTPDKDFVKMVDPDAEGATRTITDNDVEKIKKEKAKKRAASENIRLKKDVEEEAKKKQKSKNKKPRHQVVEEPDVEEEEEEYDPKMEKMTTILAIIMAVMIGAIVIFLVGRAVGLFHFEGRSDEPEEEITTQVEGEELPSEEVDLETEVDGEEKFAVPNVLGLSLAEAVSQLEKEGFKANKEEISSDTTPKGMVAGQIPGPGESAPRGSAVTIQIATGVNDNKVRVPNVIGLTEMDATVSLTEAGLSVGSIGQTTNEDASLQDKICYQSYSVGSYVAKGTTIDLKVSIGPGESSYSFIGSIAGPGEEDENYTSGTDTTVILTAANGVELYRTTTAAFPLSMNITGIKGVEDGTITFLYRVTIPGSSVTNEAGETVTTEATTEDRSIQRSVKFAKE